MTIFPASYETQTFSAGRRVGKKPVFDCDFCTFELTRAEPGTLKVLGLLVLPVSTGPLSIQLLRSRFRVIRCVNIDTLLAGWPVARNLGGVMGVWFW